MKGSLSVLSAAVLMALAASGSDSNAANSSLNTLHSSRPGSAGKNTNSIPLIHKRNAKNVKGAAFGTKKKAAQVRVSALRHGRINAPNGTGAILYDQLQTPTTDALVAQVCEVSSACSSLPDRSADSADDFVVGAGGWTVSGFNFLSTNFYNSLVDVAADVFIYPDEGGAPGATATCSSTASTNNPIDNGDGTTLAAITLNAPCSLDAGTYWVSLAFNAVGGDLNWPFYWFHSAPPVGADGMFRNPGDGFTTGCTDWTDAATCSPASDGNPYDFAFQVLGTAGGGGGGDGITLALTLAEDDGSGTAVCGTATTLTANVGDQVDLCYTVTNDSAVTLTYHSLEDSLAGQIFSLTPVELDPGASYSYTRVITASSANDGTISATWTAQDGTPGYQSDTTGASQFVDVSTTGTPLGLSDDGEASVSIPFSFNFYGTPSNLITVGNNGAIRVGTGTGTVGFSNTALPEAGAPPSIYPLWDDFDDEQGDVYTAVTGTTPNQKFYIEWADRPHYNGTDNTDGATFEVVIDEASGNFSFEYDDVAYTNTAATDGDPTDCTGGLCATIGLQSDDTLFNQFSFATASVTDGSSIAWSPSVISNVFTDSATATLNVVAPVITVDPPSLEATVDSAGTGTSTLTIGNTGDADLDFTVDEAPHAGARVGFPAVTHPFVHGQRNPNLTATKRATRLTGKDGKPLFRNYGPVPHGTTGVPAFADDPNGADFVSLDASAPGTLTSVGPLATDPLPLGGTFINNDFTTEYVITYSGSTGANDLGTIDTATGVLTDIGPLTGANAGDVLIGLTWDPTSGTLYAAAASQLYAVDPTTGAVTAAANADGVNLAAIAADSAGTIYGLDFNTASIVAIDKDTGATQQLVALPISPNYAQDMDVDLATNTLYYASYSKYGEMYSVDLDTAAITDVGPLGDGTAELTALAIAVSGSDCSSPGDVPWLSENPTSGTVPPAGSTPVTVTYDAATLADGVYNANVCVRSNDTTNATVDVPVTLTVGNGTPDDIIFQDGFDGTGGGGGTDVSFVEDDGSFENSIGLNNQTTESAAVWLNRFTLASGQFPLTLSDVQIEWPDATTSGGDLTGLAVDILVYYDADGDGNPANATKLFQGPATIDTLSAFQTYPVTATIPGGGDIYVGFENSYALAGASPGLLFPAALDQDSGSAHNSYVSAMSNGDPDVDNLGNNGLTGVIDDLASTLAGNWLIRADGQTSAGAPVVLK